MSFMSKFGARPGEDDFAIINNNNDFLEKGVFYDLALLAPII